MSSELDKLRKEVALLRKLVYKDPLTGLYNRRGFLDEGEKIFSAVRQANHHLTRRKNYFIKDLALIFVDLDDFKKVNDEFGHKVGDIILKKTANLLIGAVRLNDLVCRWGGEEMLVLLVGASDSNARRIAEELRQRIEGTKFQNGPKTIRITASFGVAPMKRETALEELVQRADKAMYKAKKSGKNKVVII